MNNNTLKILFVISTTRINKKGLAPLSCRITYLAKRKAFSTGLFINPDNWNSKKQKAIPSTKENDFINTQLSLISQKINKAFLMLQLQDIDFDVDDILLSYKGENTKKNKTFLEVLDLHLTRMEKLVGIDYAPRYYEKWQGTQKLLKGFIKSTYKKGDVMLVSLTMKFLDDLDFYLKSEKNHKQITVNKCIQRVRQVVKLAISEGFLDKDPFILYKPKRYAKVVVYLTKDELQELEQYVFSQERLEQVKDMFVFCCYTGLAYSEMANLKHEHIVIGFDNNRWIKMFRKKTRKEFSIPLLPKALEILNSYSNPPKQKIFPEISNQRFNSYLKEIADIVGVDKNLTHHIARKTFATTILLYNDIPMEIVSELLGHSNIKITQEHYAKVVKKKVSEHINSLKKKLK